MFNKLVLGNEKAVIGGLSSGVLSLLGQLGVNGQMTVKEVVYSAVTWAVTHAVVYVSTNSPKPAPAAPQTPIVAPEVTPAPSEIPTI